MSPTATPKNRWWVKTRPTNVGGGWRYFGNAPYEPIVAETRDDACGMCVTAYDRLWELRHAGPRPADGTPENPYHVCGGAVEICAEQAGPWFHGTERHFKQFDDKHLGDFLGRGAIGFWFHSDPVGAEFFGPNRAEVYLRYGNALHVSRDEFVASRQGPIWWSLEARRKNRDAVIIHDTVDGDTHGDTICIFNTDMIEIVQWQLAESED